MRSEAGFTLVELMAALTVMTLGVMGAMGVMASATRAGSVTSSRSKAVSIATEQIEAVRAIPYKNLDADPDAPTYTDTRTVGGRTFNVERAATWVNTPVAEAYKQAVVVVTWSDETGSHQIHQTTFVYPGGLGPHSAGDTVIPIPGGSPLAPSNLVASIASGIVGTTGIDLTWTPPEGSSPPPATWVVQYSIDSSFTTFHEVTSTLPADSPALRVTDLAAGTTYHFRVASKGENGNLSSTWATTYNVTTPISLALTCSVGTATVTPSAVKKRSASDGSGLVTDPLVSVNTIGACTTATFTMTYSRRAGVTQTVVLTRSGGLWTGLVQGTNQRWDVGDHDIEIRDGLNVKRATLRLVVCDHQKTTCP